MLCAAATEPDSEEHDVKISIELPDEIADQIGSRWIDLPRGWRLVQEAGTLSTREAGTLSTREAGTLL